MMEVNEVAVGVVLFGGLGLLVERNTWGGASRAVHKEHADATRAHFAAVEAAGDDPVVSPEAIERGNRGSALASRPLESPRSTSSAWSIAMTKKRIASLSLCANASTANTSGLVPSVPTTRTQKNAGPLAAGAVVGQNVTKSSIASQLNPRSDLLGSGLSPR